MHMPEDLKTETFRKLFEISDAILVEKASKEDLENVKRVYRDLSLGVKTFIGENMELDLTAVTPDKGFTKELHEIIWDSRKRTYIEESPEPLSTYPEFQSHIDKSGENWVSGNIEEAIDHARTGMDLLARSNLNRDRSLKEQIKQIDTRENVLSPRGVTHTNLYHELREDGYPSEAYFPQRPYIFSLRDACVRKLMFGKGEPSDLDILRSMAETDMALYFREIKRYPQYEAFISPRRLLKRMSREDILNFNNFIFKKVRKRLGKGQAIRDIHHLPRIGEYLRKISVI